MFYRAALGLPFFAWGAVFTGGGALSLGGASASVSASAPAAAAVAAAAGVAVPRLYLLLAGNVVGDYCCKVSVPAPPAPLRPPPPPPPPPHPTHPWLHSRQSLCSPCCSPTPPHPWRPLFKVSMTRLVGRPPHSPPRW